MTYRHLLALSAHNPIRTQRHSVGSGLALSLLALLAMLLAACGAPSVQQATTQTRAGHASTATQPLTYVAIGASDAFGIGTDDPDRQNWPTVLAGDLGPSVHLVNLGIPSETVAQAQQNELPVALDAKPKIITIWLAVNDIVDNVPLSTYSQQLSSLLTTLRQRTHAQIFVGNVPNLTVLPRFASENPTALLTLVQQWNTAIAADCAAQGAHLVDLYSEWGEIANHPEYISSDGFHPSTIGAERLAEVFAAAIRPTLTT